MIEKKTVILSMNNFFDCVIDKLPNIFQIVYSDSLEENNLIQGAITTP